MDPVSLTREELERTTYWHQELSSQLSEEQDEGFGDDSDAEELGEEVSLAQGDQKREVLLDEELESDVEGAERSESDVVARVRKEMAARMARKRKLDFVPTPPKLMTFDEEANIAVSSREVDHSSQESETHKTNNIVISKLEDGTHGKVLNIICVVIDWNRNDRWMSSLLISDYSLGYFPVVCTSWAATWARKYAQPGAIILFSAMVFRQVKGHTRGYMSNPNRCILLHQPGMKTIDAENNEKLNKVAQAYSQEILMDLPKVVEWAETSYSQVLARTRSPMNGAPRKYDAEKFEDLQLVLQPSFLHALVNVQGVIEEIRVTTTRNARFATLRLSDGKSIGEIKLWKVFSSEEHVQYLKSLKEAKQLVRITKCQVILDYYLGQYVLCTTEDSRFRQAMEVENTKNKIHSVNHLLEHEAERFERLSQFLQSTTFTNGTVRVPARLVELTTPLNAVLCCRTCHHPAQIEESQEIVRCAKNKCVPSESLIKRQPLVEVATAGKRRRIGDALRQVGVSFRNGSLPEEPAYVGFGFELQPFSIKISDTRASTSSLELLVSPENAHELTFSLPAHLLSDKQVVRDIELLLQDPRNEPFLFIFRCSRELDENGFAIPSTTSGEFIALEFK